MLDIDWNDCSVFRTPKHIRDWSIDNDERLTPETIRNVVSQVIGSQSVIYLPDALPSILDNGPSENTMGPIRDVRLAIHNALVASGVTVIRLEPLRSTIGPTPQSDWRLCNWSEVIGFPDIIIKLRRSLDGCVRSRKTVFDHSHIAPEVTHELGRMPGHYAVVGKFFPNIRPFHIASAVLSPTQIVHEFIQVINAANYMHFHGWVHGDISDSNIAWHENSALLTDLETAMPIGERAPVLNIREFREATYYPSIDNKVRSPDTDTFALGIALLRSLAFDKKKFDRHLKVLEEKSDEQGLFTLTRRVLTEVRLSALIPVVCSMLTESRATRSPLPIVISQIRQKLKSQADGENYR